MNTFKWYSVLVGVVILHLLTQPFNVYSALERRLLSTDIEWSWENALDQTFQDSLENTLNDQMVTREWWIKVNTLKDTLLGRLIFDKVMPSEHGLVEVWFEDSDQLKRNIEFLKAFEAKVNAIVNVVPHSGSLLVPSYHDDSLLYDSEGYPSLRTWLMSQSSASSLMYQGDHHLNHFATPLMAEHLFNQLGLNLIQPTLSYCADFSGTLQPYYLSFKPKLDSLWVYDTPIESIQFNNQTHSSLHDLSACEGNNAYGGLMHGNQGFSSIQTGLKNNQSLLLIKDSHAHQLIPFLALHYQTIDVVDLRHYNGSIQALVDQGYDDVVVFVGEGSVRDDRNFFKLSR
ncbi:MAG: hypothetical protein KGZ38_01655 [Erysipelothrix sp.]|nr:hypothetical protein [Erysipelothrix sp.]